MKRGKSSEKEYFHKNSDSESLNDSRTRDVGDRNATKLWRDRNTPPESSAQDRDTSFDRIFDRIEESSGRKNLPASNPPHPLKSREERVDDFRERSGSILSASARRGSELIHMIFGRRKSKDRSDSKLGKDAEEKKVTSRNSSQKGKSGKNGGPLQAMGPLSRNKITGDGRYSEYSSSSSESTEGEPPNLSHKQSESLSSLGSAKTAGAKDLGKHYYGSFSRGDKGKEVISGNYSMQGSDEELDNKISGSSRDIDSSHPNENAMAEMKLISQDSLEEDRGTPELAFSSQSAYYSSKLLPKGSNPFIDYGYPKTAGVGEKPVNHRKGIGERNRRHENLITGKDFSKSYDYISIARPRSTTPIRGSRIEDYTSDSNYYNDTQIFSTTSGQDSNRSGTKINIRLPNMYQSDAETSSAFPFKDRQKRRKSLSTLNLESDVDAEWSKFADKVLNLNQRRSVKSSVSGPKEVSLPFHRRTQSMASYDPADTTKEHVAPLGISDYGRSEKVPIDVRLI
ncbi:unnamed protein product [Gordionus sp. m RMFG-2023]